MMMSCIKYFWTRISQSGMKAMLPYPLRVRGLSSSSSSPSSSLFNYDLFFPSFYREYMSDLIEYHTSRAEKLMDPLASCSLTRPVNKLPDTCPDFENKPHYYYSDFDHLNNEPITIENAQHFDVISLLSTHADDLVRIGSNDVVKVNDLRGKYILLCCGFVPSLWIDSFKWRGLSLLSSELSQTNLGHNHVEIVIVPKMRRKWDNDEGVFHHFFSAFSGCLTIPFTHKHRRDYICKSLNFEGKHIFVFVDPSHKVLQDYSGYIVKFGARGFPFTDEHCHCLFAEGYKSRSYSPSFKSLAGLLSCESNPSFLLRKFDSEETISVEQLNKKHVGLYLFNTGSKLKIIHDIYQQCRNQGLDFEIVLVYIPVVSPIDPEMYQDIVDCFLRKYKVSNWWVFPYNNSACARLHRLSAIPGADSLFLVGPHDKFVIEEAGLMISYFGYHFGAQLYPFTLDALLKAFFQKLDTVTLESFFIYDYVYRDYACDDTKTMPVSELKGKNVIVYVDDTSRFRSGWETCVADISQWYNKMKEKDSDIEVVFVPVMYAPSETEYRKLVPKVREFIFNSKTKWLVCPFEEAKQSRYLRKHEAFMLSGVSLYSARQGVELSSVLAFGKDGHLHSQYALRLFEEDGLDSYPFLPESRNEVRRREITDQLFTKFEFWHLFVADE